MLLVTGALLMATWGLSLLIAAFAGHTLISRVRTAGWALAGPAMWWGLSFATLITLVVSLVLPLQGQAALVVLLVLVLAGVIGILLRRRPAQQVSCMPWRLDWIMVAWVVPMAGACIAIAILAAGMPTNYDTGLYHLNAIGYAHDFGTVPGLANLHDRLGFNASIYPLAAVLSNGLWTGQGFRVITGLFLVAMATDATLRISRSRSRRSPGTGVMVVGTVLILGYAVQEPGRLIASPVADVMAAVLTVVSTAYLLDAVSTRRSLLAAVSTRRSLLAAATAVVVACLAATARPLGWVFVLLVVSVLLLRLRRDLQGGITWLAALLGGSLLMVMLARDVLLSGWLLYPLGLFSVPVEWQVPDPTLTREAISAWGRAPHMPVEVAQDWSAWFPGWITSLTRDWAIVSLALLAMGAGCLLLALVMRHRRWPSLQASWWLAVVPAAVTSVIWFITAPDPRFAWGLLLCIGLVPFASVIAVSPRARRLLPAAGGVVLCCALALSWFRGGFIPVLKDTKATQASLGPWSITLQLAPVKQVEARRVLILDGSTVIEPAEGLQCWSLFPLCRVPGSEPGIERRGVSPGDGFRVAANGLAG